MQENKYSYEKIGIHIIILKSEQKYLLRINYFESSWMNFFCKSVMSFCHYEVIPLSKIHKSFWNLIICSPNPPNPLHYYPLKHHPKPAPYPLKHYIQLSSSSNKHHSPPPIPSPAPPISNHHHHQILTTTRPSSPTNTQLPHHSPQPSSSKES